MEFAEPPSSRRGSRSHPQPPAPPRDPDNPILAMIEQDEQVVRRRLPAGLPRRPHDVYVTQHTKFKAQLGRCQAVLDQADGPGLVWIHGLGVAQNRAVNLALTLAAQNLGRAEVSPHTSTVECVDLVDSPAAGQFDRVRPQSAIHIKVARVAAGGGPQGDR